MDIIHKFGISASPFYNMQRPGSTSIIYLFIAIGAAFYLLAPGVWWGDTLNNYIHGISGQYGSAQPILIDLIFNMTRQIYPGSLIVFSGCIIAYFTGFYLMVFGLIRHRIWAPVLFFSFSFYPSLFSNIGVLQTEAIQLATVALFIPLTIRLYQSDVFGRRILFAILCVCLAVFSLIRYDTIHLVLIMSYGLCYSLYRRHGTKTIATTAILLGGIYLTGIILKHSVNLPDDSDATMKNALLVTDIAAISAESGHNYVPDYCWRTYLGPEERSVGRLQTGLRTWRNAFFSYIYNIDPSIGVFTFDIQEHEADLKSRWWHTILSNPGHYIHYHLLMFGYLIDNDNFNMGLWSGLKDSHVNHTRIQLERTPSVDTFLARHDGRYAYANGYLELVQDQVMISDSERASLCRLVEPRREADVQWMVWYSHIPRSLYMTRNERAEKYVEPFMEWYMKHFRWLSCILPFAVALLLLLVWGRRRIPADYLRVVFILICVGGLLHLSLRALVITDSVFRFGILAVFLSFFAMIMLAGAILRDE